MGNDGGSIPRRNELVREKKHVEKPDLKAQLAAMYTTCALSERQLEPPIVGDGIGRLYNREAILEYLLDNNAFGDNKSTCSHIKSLKDVKTLKLKANPLRDEAKASDGQSSARFVCPITMREMNGNLPFEFTWTCGCVYSAQARKEMQNAGWLDTECIVCGEHVEAEDVIPINSLDADVLDELRQNMERRKKKTKKKSKSKSKEKRKRSDKDAVDCKGETDSVVQSVKRSKGLNGVSVDQ
ncbi:Replication termination factor 2 [Coemansia sp. RSA 2703]|nr:Replication termination factor 2 [Coemansia sp. RSA 2703]KAJ2374135.1 Replication termination factor 2 [Coemansia sp. RSA 2607]KAJ2394342.1 Replication termination factor 2 [Coemansia sp. RSA 2603]